MDIFYLVVLLFLFVLAVFDLSVGVANDAVNFLSPAVGAKAAKFRTILIVAAVGIFVGATTSSGMMDIARHGIFTPNFYSFNDVMCIFLAVAATDVILMDIFNTLGMPTSTTVSMVFGLLGGSTALAMTKIWGGQYTYEQLINTDKALQVIIAIFLSVAIAFVFGLVVMWLTRIIFTFNYKKHLRWTIALFGGVGVTSIFYFLIVSGLKGSNLLKDLGVSDWIDQNHGLLLLYCFCIFTVLAEVLHLLKVNIFKIIVLFGTFSLAMAFAGNDLVNFIGTPLAGLESFLDFTHNGNGEAAKSYTMDVLAGESALPYKHLFLLAAGIIMTTAVCTSKKAHKVVQTTVNLSRQDEGEEVFSSSRIARKTVRSVLNTTNAVSRYIPNNVKSWINTRFNSEEATLDDGVAFDLVRASVNLVLAGLLIVVGTTLQLPLSTTYVAFMVAMGSSLADRAWSRESAVFRITGVLTVIGGWFLTAGVAFSACFFVALLMNYGGVPAAAIIVCLGLYSIIHSQRKYSKKKKEEEKNGDVLFNEIITCAKPQDVPMMLNKHLDVSTGEMLSLFADAFKETTEGLFVENLRALKHASKNLSTNKRTLKNLRRRETICLRHADPPTAIKLSTTFHLAHNSMRQILYGLIRINEPAKEHVDNHFTPIDRLEAEQFSKISKQLTNIIMQAAENLREQRIEDNETLREECEMIRGKFNELRDIVLVKIQRPDINITSETLLLHIIQESEQLCIEIRHLLKLTKRFKDSL